MTTPTICTATRHGTAYAYSKFNCRCPEGREAWRVTSYARRHGLHEPALVDPASTIGRLRILVGVGYDWRTLARELGYASPRAVTDLVDRRGGTVHRRTRTRVRDLYNRLMLMPAPAGYAAGRATNTAVRRGWGVVDLVAVRRVLAGQPVALTPLERRALFYTGEADLMRPTAIAEAARCSGAYVNTVLAA